MYYIYCITIIDSDLCLDTVKPALCKKIKTKIHWKMHSCKPASQNTYEVKFA